MRRHLLVPLTLTGLASLLLAGSTEARPRAPWPCANAVRFLIGGEALAGEAAAAVPDVVEIDVTAQRLTIQSGCPATRVRIKRGRKRTRVRAGWTKGACTALAGRVRLEARIDPACAGMSGVLRAKRHKRRFEAVAAACAGGPGCPAIDGPPDALARDALPDRRPTPVPADEITADPRGGRVVRTRLEIAFVPSATTGEINALLAGIGASVDAALAGVSLVVVRIPDPGDLATLDAIVAGLAADPRVRYVHREVLPETQELPPNFVPPGGDPGVLDLSSIAHHLAIRAHAAWNARTAIAVQPLVVLQDFFGDGPPDAAVAADLGPPFADFATGNPDAHGYHVLGILAGAFDGPGTCLAAPPAPPLAPDARRGCVTGLYPAPVALRVIDLAGNLGAGAGDVETILALRSAPGPAILNTSLGHPDCYGNAEATATRARAWIEKVRDTGLEQRFLHATSAGNVDPDIPAITDSLTNSAYAGAAFLPALQEGDGTPIANLTNLLVVENLVGFASEPHGPLCLAATSKFPGHVGGIGTDVFSLTDASASTGRLSGTSMATPQIAGLAAFLWSIAPAASLQEILRAIEESGVAPLGAGAGCADVDPAPAIDAFAAVLSLDPAALPTAEQARVRLALLDVDDDGDFDGDDLFFFPHEYIDAFTDAETHGPPVEPAQRDYGRYDLNGDGFTGGSNTEPFDLDRVGSTQYGPAQHDLVVQTIDGEPRLFDEQVLTDLEILCYYAWSGLYRGTAAARAGWIDPDWCNPAVVEAVLPSEIAAGSETLLVVRARVERASGDDLHPDGLTVEIDADGATVGALSGATSDDGFFETTVEPLPGASDVTLQVRLRAGTGGPVLAETTVSAEVVGPVEPSFHVVQRTHMVEAGIAQPVADSVFASGASSRVEARVDVDEAGSRAVSWNASNVIAVTATLLVEVAGQGIVEGGGTVQLNQGHVVIEVVGEPVPYRFYGQAHVESGGEPTGQGTVEIVLDGDPTTMTLEGCLGSGVPGCALGDDVSVEGELPPGRYTLETRLTVTSGHIGFSGGILIGDEAQF